MKKDWMIKESELDDDQVLILHATLDKSCIVTGCAGSGKSVLALIKAQRIQKEKGKNYEIIVYTKALCHYMNSGRKELGLANSIVYHWQWKNRMSCKPADYIIVDEIQDFTEDEILEFVHATRKNFFFFGDTAQSIYEGLKETVPVEDIGYLMPHEGKPKYWDLYRNHRLPISVARFVQSIGVDLPPFQEKVYRNPLTIKPRIIRYGSLRDQILAIKRIITNNSYHDVAILVPHNDTVRTVGNYLQQMNVSFEQKYSDKNDYTNSQDSLDFTTTNPKVMTYHSAKGLQFEAVFLPALELYNERLSDNTRKSLYVAMTRTYKYLYVMYAGSLPSVLTGIDKNLYIETEVETIEDI